MIFSRKSLLKESAALLVCGIFFGALVWGQTYSLGNSPSGLTAIEQALTQGQATLSQSAANLLAAGAAQQNMDNWLTKGNNKTRPTSAS